MEAKFSRRDFLRISALTAAGVALASCTPSPVAPPTERPTEPPAQAPTQAPPAAEKKVIDVWFVSNDVPIMAANERFMADHPDVEVRPVQVQNDPYKTKIKAAVGAGNAPCVFVSWGGGPLYEYVKGGQVLDLTSYMNQDNYKDRFVAASFTAVSFEGKIWGVPYDNTAVALVWYNRAIYEANGLTTPATYDEMLAGVDKLLGAGAIPFALANKTKWPGSMYYMYFVDRLGGPEVFNAAATRSGGSFEDPAFVQAGKMVQDLVRKGAFNEGFNGLDWDTGQSRALLYADKAAMEIMGSWNAPIFKEENPEFYENKMGFFPFPAIPEGKGSPNGLVGSVGQMYFHISSNCPHPNEAFKWIQYNTDDVSAKLKVGLGEIPPFKGLTYEDPVLQAIVEIVERASSVQLWYDQFLPPELGEVHKDTIQALFGLEITPEEAAKAHEDAARKYYGEG